MLIKSWNSQHPSSLLWKLNKKITMNKINKIKDVKIRVL
jgi:hypothetical protein